MPYLRIKKDDFEVRVNGNQMEYLVFRDYLNEKREILKDILNEETTDFEMNEGLYTHEEAEERIFSNRF